MYLSITAAQGSHPKAPFILQNNSFCTHLVKAAALGFEAVELQLANPAQLDVDALQRQCDRLGMRISSLATGLACRDGLSLSAKDTAVRSAAVERLRAQIDLALNLNGVHAVMIGLLIGKRAADYSPNQYLQNLACSLLHVADYAARRNIRICLEPVNHYDSNMLNTWEETAQFLDRFGCSTVSLGLDLYHMRMEELDIEATIRRYASRIGLVQIMDSNRKAPGLGCFRFEALARAILDTGYDGPIIMECLPLPDPDTAMRLSVDFYNTFFV